MLKQEVSNVAASVGTMRGTTTDNNILIDLKMKRKYLGLESKHLILLNKTKSLILDTDFGAVYESTRLDCIVYINRT